MAKKYGNITELISYASRLWQVDEKNKVFIGRIPGSDEVETIPFDSPRGKKILSSRGGELKTGYITQVVSEKGAIPLLEQKALAKKQELALPRIIADIDTRLKILDERLADLEHAFKVRFKGKKELEEALGEK